MTVNDDVEARDRASEKRLRAVGKAAAIAPERLTILSESQASLPDLGAEVMTYKVVDRESGDSRRIALDARGRPQDVDELLAKEQAAARERRGVMQEALYELAEARGAEDETVPVMLRYGVDEDPIDLDKRELDDTELDERRVAALGEQARRQQRRVLRRAQALHREVVEAHKLDPRVAGRPRVSGPFVRSRVPLRALAELSRDERIAFIGLDDEKEVLDHPTIPQSLPTTRADTVHSSGFRGAGVKVAVLESGGLWKPAACFNIGATQVAGSAANDHMTKSVGIIGNRYSSGGCSGSWQGYAPDATVLLANESAYQDRYDWARGQGVNVVTMSWHFGSEETSGSLHSRDVYFDYWVTRYPYPSVLASAGNEAASDAFASGKGYNFLGVANVVNDGDGNRCNDAISGDSSRKNPTSPHSDHEVPGLAAPGSRHDLLGSSFGGTSCATPVTAAISALLMSANTSLKIWPEAIRAILLATANYQRADGADYTKYADGADGVGLINAHYARLTASQRESGTTPQFRAHDYGLMTASDFSGGMFTKEWKAQTYTTSSRIRVALTWNSKVAASGGVPSSSVLNADLDLWIYDPDGYLVAFGTTWDNSWEFIELTPVKTGVYTIKVRGYSVPSDFSSWYGVAWTTHYDLC
jgi:subtilisin